MRNRDQKAIKTKMKDQEPGLPWTLEIELGSVALELNKKAMELSIHISDSLMKIESDFIEGSHGWVSDMDVLMQEAEVQFKKIKKLYKKASSLRYTIDAYLDDTN